MTSDNGDVHRLHRDGLSIRAIAERLGLSRMKVHRTLAAEPDTDPDPWDDEENVTEDDLALWDTTEERWPPEPFVYVGTERQYFERGKGERGYWADCERWVDGEGHSIGDEHESAEMALYRYRNHVACELDDRERADALAADWDRQRAEYEARERA